eukprot:scaffold735_cov116-Cylindrotheca_fusiformis.AAC.21
MPFVFELYPSIIHNDSDTAQFAGLGSEVSTVAGQKVDQIYSALDSFSAFISSEVEADPNTNWPFVLVRSFSLKAEKTVELVALTNPAVLFMPIVHEEDREGWGSFAMESAPVYYQESLKNEGINYSTVEDLTNITVPFLYTHGRDENWTFTGPIEIQRPGPVLPFWQSYPLWFPVEGLMFNGFDMLVFPEIANQLPTTNLTLRALTTFVQLQDTRPGAKFGDVIVDSQIMQPIVENKKLVGVIIMKLPWIEFFLNLYVDGLTDTIAVIRSSCNIGIGSYFNNTNEMSYLINSTSADFLGQLDAHDPKYDDLVVSRVILDVDVDEADLPEGICVPTLTLDLYPTEELEASFQTSKPKLYTLVVVAIFFFTSLVFVLYDFFVGRRQRKFMARIKRQDQIVSNVFPAAIRDRLYEDEQKGSKHDGLLDPLGAGAAGAGGAPLADLFLETTVVFADIAGFTAWSSAREPAQVFVLLETIYGAFDKHAYRHNVFKVETVGDCYVAVAGLPEPDKDHAMSVCRFARDCLKTMKETTLKLEVSLGPDTSELELRVGVHR